MAIQANTVWEVRTTGSDSNGGGWNTTAASGSDYSQQDAAQLVIDGATVTVTVHTSTTSLNVTGYTVVAGDNGNIINATGGSAPAGHYQITSVDTANNRWTVDRSAGTAGQTMTGNLGGAKASPGAAVVLQTTGNKIFIKSGTYTFTTSTAGNDGPLVSASNNNLYIEGYQTTRSDFGTKPEINAGSISSITMISFGATGSVTIRNIRLNGNSQTSVIGIAIGSRHQIIDCEVVNCTSVGFNSGGVAVRCLAENCGTGYTTDAFACVAKDCTGNGFTVSTDMVTGCVAYGCGGDGFNIPSAGRIAGCSAYDNAGNGFNITSTSGTAVDCIAVGNGSYGFNTSQGIQCRTVNCAGYNNTSGDFHATVLINHIGNISLSADPFTNAAGGDFSLNNTAGGGAVCRAAGLDVIGQTDYRDIGAIQHADPASSGGYYIGGGF